VEPLDKTPLTEQAAEAIKRQILTQHLQTGDRLPSERQLCETLGISRSILREALSVLVGQKIVTKVPGKGVFVADFDRRSLGVDIRLIITDRAELGALRDLRNMLEIGALELVVQRITPEELDRLAGMIEEMEQQVSQGGWINELDAQFHLALFRAAHVPALLRLYEQVLRDVTDVTVFQNPQVRDVLTPEIGKSNLSLLCQVVDALRRGDVRQAQRAMKAHILM
jgi:DNA-binding FadR family transcriptional regulator